MRICVDQAIYGYRDGHRLLASSHRIPTQAERVLLTLSDLSGSRVLEGFFEYVTGYPVPGEERYAFSKTWYAHEMERPGCVWTHVLFITIEDLGSLVQPQNLSRFFRAPTNNGFAEYQEPLVVEQEDNFFALQSGPYSRIAGPLLQALYDETPKPVVVPADSVSLVEPLVLQVWAQQWSSLRAGFRFCTGSLSPRNYMGEPFDLQVVPTRTSRELMRQPSTYRIVGLDSVAEEASGAARWLSFAVADLINPAGSEFRALLQKYADSSFGRAEYRRFATTVAAINEAKAGDVAGSKLLAILAEVFPKPTEAEGLKCGLLGQGCPKFPPVLPSLSEADRLRLLVTTEFWSSFDPYSLRIRSRASDMWTHEPSEVKELLLAFLRDGTQPFGNEFVRGVADVITATDACELEKENRGVLPVLVSRNSRLAADPNLWRLCPGRELQHELVDIAVTASESTGLQLESIVRAILDAGADHLATTLVHCSASTVSAALSWFDSYAGARDLSPAWREAIASRTPEVVAWVGEYWPAANKPTLLLVSTVLDPHSDNVRQLGLDPWLRLIADAPKTAEPEAMAFLLTLGFTEADARAVELVAYAFEPVHNALRRNALRYRSWLYLRQVLPSLTWWNDWDNCERLRRGLVRAFVARKWPPEAFIRCSRDPDLYQRVLKAAKAVDVGEEFLRLLAQYVITHRDKASEHPRAIDPHKR